MASLIVNRSAQIALRTLNKVQANADIVRERIASGLKVASPKDNAAFFLVAAETRGDVVLAKGIRENLVGIDSALTTSSSGIASIRENLDNIRNAIIAGENSGYDNGLDVVIEYQIEAIRETIGATSSGDQNFLAEDGDQTVVLSTSDQPGGGLKVNTLTIRSLNLDERAVSPTEGLVAVPALANYDLSSGGSVVRFGNQYKVTSLTTDNVTNTDAGYDAYRDGPATADPAPLIPHPTGSQKQWTLSSYTDDFRTRSGTGNSVFSGDGNDRVILGTDDSIAVGGAGDDFLEGIRDNNQVWGDDGDDYLRVTRDGNIAVGGTGNDTMRGNSSAAIYFGGEGNDDIRPGGGDDIIIGGVGDDDIRGGNGFDHIYEGLNSGSDSIRLNGDGGAVYYEGDASQYTINVINGSRFQVTDTLTGDVDDIRNGDPTVLVFNTAPPDQPDRPVTQSFFDSLVIDYSALTDPVAGEELRDNLTFMALVELLDPDTAGYSVSGALQVLDSALRKLNFGESQLGAYQTTIRRTIEGSRNITDQLEQGIAALVETDFDEESARLAAVQVQENLALESLSIANSRQSNILSLFS